MANTNIKYLKENNLFEAHQHFMQLCEAFPFEMDEAGDDPNAQQDPNAMGGAPGGDPMGGGAPGADPMGGGAPGGDPMAGGPDAGADPMAGGMGDDPMAGGLEEGEPEEN
jgi:hypothetical protein